MNNITQRYYFGSDFEKTPVVDYKNKPTTAISDNTISEYKEISEGYVSTKGLVSTVEYVSTNIKIKIHNPICKPESIEKGDWIDLKSAETVKYKAGDFFLISLGVSMKLPEGFEAHLAPRSSTFKKYGIIQTNSVGVIDESYSGNDDIWKFPAYALRDGEIQEGERFCQFRIVEKMPKINFEEVDDLESESRGGFGSTGV